MKRLFTVVLVLALSLTAHLAYGLPEHIGTIKAVDGEVVVVRNTQTIKGAANLMLFQGDVIETGANGKVGLILEDDTVISMGRKSRLVLTQFQFQPRQKNLSLLVRLLQGTAAFICGEIARLAPSSFKILTPQAAIGVRGSHVLVKVD